MTEHKVEKSIDRSISVTIPFICAYCKQENERTISIREFPNRKYVNVFDEHSINCRSAKLLELNGYVKDVADCCWNCGNSQRTSHEDHDWMRCKLVARGTWRNQKGKKYHEWAAVSPSGSCNEHSNLKEKDKN